MRLFYALLFIVSSQAVKGQLFDVAAGQKILSTDNISLTTAKRLLGMKYNFLLTGDTSYRGNVNWAFESKDENKYELILLFSTVFNQVTYIQFLDNINQASNYKSLIQKMGYSPQGVRYSMNGTIATYGYRKNDLLFVIELGAERGKCKIHFSKQEN
ncbi:MAG: hypothetical protein HYU71_12455 [Bacteroidetes bacterium]|nr:hypothetical protein [Bacteroidota bacterium]